MTNVIHLSLHTMPIDLVYRILDHLDVSNIALSCRNVCSRLDAITSSYRRYKVSDDMKSNHC